ncbi:hypothetical protein [Synechococcus sp. MU1643]|uniref:hypothetical protein n=1 Tax=Synechococcus sp. MU1643 TaxID=2508349 RepID=UPI001CF866A4|nr:hypothetical protein [Synechococcus sp. MU1643]
MAATLRLKVRGFMSPASTSSRSWDTQNNASGSGSMHLIKGMSLGGPTSEALFDWNNSFG